MKRSLGRDCACETLRHTTCSLQELQPNGTITLRFPQDAAHILLLSSSVSSPIVSIPPGKIHSVSWFPVFSLQFLKAPVLKKKKIVFESGNE